MSTVPLPPPSSPGAHEAPITTQNPQLFPGIHFLGTPWKQTVTSEGQEISWDSIGVAFSIPPGAVPEDEESQLTVQPCVTGPFEPPDQYQFTSPSYHVSLSCKFTKDVEIILHHTILLKSDDDCKRMTFFSAPSSPMRDGSQPQYKFQVQRGGVFRKHESFGTIKLRHFCYMSTGIDESKPPGDGTKPPGDAPKPPGTGLSVYFTNPMVT